MSKMCEYKDKEYLYHEYVVLEKSTIKIGEECGISAGAIFYWLQKYNIPRRSISESLMGEKNPSKRPEVRAKRIAWWTLERRVEKSESMMGEKHYHFGKSPSEEIRIKMIMSYTSERRFKHSELMMEKWKNLEYIDKYTGENHWNWQDGKSFEPYGVEFNDELKEQIRRRDNYICQECGIIQEKIERKLDVHHIDYNKKNNKPENLICLCPSCHSKTNYNREDWTKYFKKIMNERDFLMNEQEIEEANSNGN